MFGRRKTEDYDEYNERVNAKYDDDYVREEKEYRSECTHSHEQTYEDYTSVRDCDHEHGQTYSNYTKVDTPDYDSIGTDRRSYDNANAHTDDGQAKEFFENQLTSGEHIIFVGKSRSPLIGVGCAKAIVAFVFIFFVNEIIGFFLQGVMFMIHGMPGEVPGLISMLITIGLLVTVLVKMGGRGSDFCITDKRLLIANGKNIFPMMLGDITNVSLTRNAPASNGGNTREYVTYSYKGMNRVLDAGNDNERVLRILQYAVKSANDRTRRS